MLGGSRTIAMINIKHGINPNGFEIYTVVRRDGKPITICSPWHVHKLAYQEDIIFDAINEEDMFRKVWDLYWSVKAGKPHWRGPKDMDMEEFLNGKRSSR